MLGSIVTLQLQQITTLACHQCEAAEAPQNGGATVQLGLTACSLLVRLNDTTWENVKTVGKALSVVGTPQILIPELTAHCFSTVVF